jgi:hypothetical protein
LPKGSFFVYKEPVNFPINIPTPIASPPTIIIRKPLRQIDTRASFALAAPNTKRETIEQIIEIQKACLVSKNA